MKTTTCHNCGAHFEGNFCFQCGQKVSANQKLAFATLVADFFDNTFNLHKGFFYTLWKLIVHPSVVTHSYLDGKRKTYTNPTRYLVIALAAFAAVHYWTPASEVIHNESFEGFSFLSASLNESMRLWDLQLLSEWTLLGNLIEALVFPFGFYVLFRALRYNYSELLVLSFYLVSNSIFLVILLDGLPRLLFNTYVPVLIVFATILIYYLYALINFFKKVRLFKRIFFIFIGLIIFVLVRFFFIPLVLALLFPLQ